MMSSDGADSFEQDADEWIGQMFEYLQSDHATAVARRYVKDRDIARDVVADVIVKALSSRGTLERASRVSDAGSGVPYAMRMVVNRAKRVASQRAREVPSDLQSPLKDAGDDEDDDPGFTVVVSMHGDMLARLREEISPDDAREAIQRSVARGGVADVDLDALRSMVGGLRRAWSSGLRTLLITGGNSGDTEVAQREVEQRLRDLSAETERAPGESGAIRLTQARRHQLNRRLMSTAVLVFAELETSNLQSEDERLAIDQIVAIGLGHAARTGRSAAVATVSLAEDRLQRAGWALPKRRRPRGRSA